MTKKYTIDELISKLTSIKNYYTWIDNKDTEVIMYEEHDAQYHNIEDIHIFHTNGGISITLSNAPSFSFIDITNYLPNLALDYPTVMCSYKYWFIKDNSSEDEVRDILDRYSIDFSKVYISPGKQETSSIIVATADDTIKNKMFGSFLIDESRDY